MQTFREDTYSNLVSSLGLCLLGTRWEISPMNGGQQALLMPHSPWGSLATAVPGRDLACWWCLLQCWAGLAPQHPSPPCVNLGSLPCSCSISACAFPSLQTGRGSLWGACGTMSAGGIVLPAWERWLPGRVGSLPHTKGFPGAGAGPGRLGQDGPLLFLYFLLPAYFKPFKDAAWETASRQNCLECYEQLFGPEGLAAGPVGTLHTPAPDHAPPAILV